MERRLILDWQEDALCAQTDPEVFHPESGSYRVSQMARMVCRNCVVIDSCLAYALEHPDLHGIWGGTTYTQRQKLRGKAS